MKTSDFDYELPEKFIAQTPAEPRDSSRLMVYERESQNLEHTTFTNLPAYLQSGDILVLNKTRVIPARMFGKKIPTGGKVEVLLLRKIDDVTWKVLVGGKRLFTGKRIAFDDTVIGEITEDLEGATRIIRFSKPIDDYVEKFGNVPLPPYIHKPLEDAERYQTIYAKEKGSAAAPTAGLHFTQRLLRELSKKGIQFAEVTLHVGLDTFSPVNEEDPRKHKIHTEWCSLDENNAVKINQAIERGNKVVAVGTTSVRTIETAAAKNGRYVLPYEGQTSLFILPGYQYKIVDAMITNFHLPRSTLLMLVSAFAGREEILRLYEIAKEQGYRFFSFGDAMLIL